MRDETPPARGSSPPRDLTAHTVRFCRALRARGMGVTPAQSGDALRVLEAVDLGDREEVRHGLRAALVSRPEELAAFDAAFDVFWRALPSAGEGGAPAGGAPEREDGAPADERGLRADELAPWADEEAGAPEPLGLPGRSEVEALMRKDFSSFGAAELAEVERVAAQIARRLATRKGRRLKPARRRGRVDLRRTLRLSLMRGEAVELARRARRILKPKLVVLCDVSGSMDLYSRLLVQFLYALQNQLGRMETFVFATRLERVTRELLGHPYEAALARLAKVQGWSGGTRIGESLQAFDAGWRHGLDRDTVVIVLSDGWDTGDPAVLGEALARIRRRAAKVVWLNPLLGSPDYQPLTQGMVAALPHVDAFLPAHSLEALRSLVRHLSP